MNLVGKRFFISGGAGVIGVELVHKLLKAGATVMVGDLKPRPIEFPHSVLYRQGDLKDMRMQEAETFAPEYFIHLAATFERSVESESFWPENFKDNILLSHHLLEIFSKIPTIKKIVFASSYLIYDKRQYTVSTGDAPSVTLNEGSYIYPRNLTGAAKLSHEIELDFLQRFKTESLSLVCARIFRGYGKGSRDVISRWVRSLLAGEPIYLFDGESRFDYIYAADTAEGLLRLSVTGATGIINLGSGVSRSVNDIVSILRLYFPQLVLRTQEGSGNFEASVADITKLSQLIHWIPQYTLETAIPEIINYERRRLTSNVKDNVYSVENILLSSSGSKVPMIKAIIAAAKRVSSNTQIYAGDTSSTALSFHVADNFWIMPKTEEQFLQDIISGCKSRNINLVIPSRDGELLFWASHKEIFRQHGIHILCSDFDSIATCFDKLRFSEFGTSLGLPFIPSFSALHQVTANRIVVKERFGAGSRNIGINLSKEDAGSFALQLQEPIFQPYIDGMEISIDAWLDSNGKAKGIVLRRRQLIVDGESKVTTTFRDNHLELQATEILEAMHLSGPIVLQAIVVDQKELHVIECNARFGGASTASIAVGLDSFFWSILEANRVPLSDYHFMRLNQNVTQVRVQADSYMYTK